MNMRGKIAKTEWILLLMGAVFLILVGTLYLRAVASAEGVGYTVSTRRQTHEQVTPEPMAPVDINRADSLQLQTLDGIGPALAERIIAYREENGPFAAVEDLLQVSGIGESTLENLKDRVTVGTENGADTPAKEAER